MAKAKLVNNSPTMRRMIAAQDSLTKAGFGRHYLGPSAMGSDCDAKLWMTFRWFSDSFIPGETQLKFDDGNYSERVTAQRLKNTPGVALMTEDRKSGEQFGFTRFGGHLRGHIDGYIAGPIDVQSGISSQMGKCLAIWEHKCTDENRFRRLLSIIEKHGRKEALYRWDKGYWIQAQLYMAMASLNWHFLTVSTSGSRDYLELATRFDAGGATAQLQRANNLIASDRMPKRITGNPDYFPCNLCDHTAICYKNVAPAVTCRSCIYAEVVIDDTDDATWRCAKHQKNLSIDAQRKACPDHLYLPGALQWMATQIDCDDRGVIYEHKSENHNLFINGPGGQSSLQIFEQSRVNK